MRNRRGACQSDGSSHALVEGRGAAPKGARRLLDAIASLKRNRTLTQDGPRSVELHLTTHGFATGLTEAKDLLKTRKPADPHPLVDLPGFHKRLDDFQAGAEKRLVVERQEKAN